MIMVEDVEEIFGKRPWVSRSQEIMEAEKASQPKLEDMPEAVKQAQAEHEAALRAKQDGEGSKQEQAPLEGASSKESSKEDDGIDNDKKGE